MFFLNIIICFLILAGITIYKFLYPKRPINLLILLILLMFLPLISLLRPGTYESGDLTINVINSMEYFRSLMEGNILPQWAGLSNATYGYPLFLFIYPLPYLITIIFHILGFSFVASLKLFIATAFILSGIGMYFWTKDEFSEKSGFVAAIFYLFAPYHLLDMHYRISTGEIASFAILPLAFFCAKKNLTIGKLRWFLGLSASLSFLILSNQAIALTAFLLIFIYSLLTWYLKKGKNINELIKLTISFVLSLLFSAFYWVPAVFQAKFTHQADFVKEHIGFAQLSQLLYSPWRYGFLFQGPNGELSFLIGYAQILVTLTVIYLLIKGKIAKSIKINAIFYLLITLIVSFMMISASKPIWDNIKILRNFQFTWRLLMFTSLTTSVLAAIAVTKLKQKWVILLCITVILQSILNWGNRRPLPQIEDTAIRAQIPLVTGISAGFHPAVPKWVKLSNPWFYKIPAQHIELLKGNAQIKSLKRTSTYHEYIIAAKSQLNVKENTTYFPGWKVKLNGKETAINPDNPKYPGVITFSVPKGFYLAEIAFEDTLIVRIGKIISLSSILLTLLLIFIIKKLKFLPKL